MADGAVRDWREPPAPSRYQPLLDRVDAWLAELWAAENMTLHMRSGQNLPDQLRLLRLIRFDAAQLRAIVQWRPEVAPRLDAHARAELLQALTSPGEPVDD